MNALAREFRFFSLLRFAVPTIVMMLVLSFYTVVDGIFVSRFVGSNALSAVNIAMPLVNIVSGIGVMFATGGSAIVAKEMGENQEDRARGHFTLIVISSIVVGILFALVGFLFTGPIVRALGATELLYEDCYIYSYICLLFAPANIVKCLFDYFMVTAGKPQIGLANSVLGGVINIVLDYVFIVPMGMGVAGAAIATGLGQLLPAIVGILYFVFGTNILHFQKPTFEGKMLAHCCVNGASEMVTNLSMGITTFLFNMAMLHYLGENGVAAITIVLYAQFLMVSIFLGFTSGVAPVISFHYGAQNWEQERRIIRYCYTFLIACSIITLALSILFAPFLMGIFSPEGTEVYDLALQTRDLVWEAFCRLGSTSLPPACSRVFQRTDLRTFIPAAHTCVRCVGHCTPALFPGVGRCVADNSRRGAWRDHFLLVFYLEIPQSVWLRGRGGTLEEGKRGSAIVTGGLTAHIGQRNKDKKPDGTTDILFSIRLFIAVIIPPAPW